MRRNNLTFAVFALAILFSMVREWKAPIACPRSTLYSSRSQSPAPRQNYRP